MKLNIGSGTLPVPGYVNVDINKFEGVDVIADVMHLPYEDESVEESFAKDVLEHMGWHEWRDALKEWCRVLKPGGVLKIRFPDLDKLIEGYQKNYWKVQNNPNPSEYEMWRFNFERFTQLVFGDQNVRENTHTAGLCPKLVETELQKLDMKVVQTWYDGLADYRITAIKAQEVDQKPLVSLDHPDYALR